MIPQVYSLWHQENMLSLINNYVQVFGEKPHTNVYSPLEKGDYPELDDSELLDEEGVTQYQSIIGSL